MATHLPTHNARVLEVISGDDLVLMVDLAVDDLFKKVRARLQGVDTPDAYRSKGDTEAGKVRDQVRELVRNVNCKIAVHSQGRGGWVVTLYIPSADGKLTEVNEMLREQGYVFPAERKEQKHV